jgi:hypothetical protein
MKSYSGFALVWICALAAPLTTLLAAPPEKPAAKKTTSLTNAEPVIPSSVFVIPSRKEDGRDPFFPQSTRLFASQQPVVPTEKNAKPIEVPLTLTGIIPLKLAMVNGRTFEQGEEGEVNANGVRKKIRCIKITSESAIVELLPEGERRELKLRFGAN